MNDYISRQAVLDLIYEQQAFYENERKESEDYGSEMECVGSLNALTAMEDGLSDIPAANVRPVVYGEWVWSEEWDNHPETHSCELISCGWYCSECGIELGEYLTKATGEYIYLDDDYEKPKLKYCPHCGAYLVKKNNNG